jgi:hypothetical protein
MQHNKNNMHNKEITYNITEIIYNKKIMCIIKKYAQYNKHNVLQKKDYSCIIKDTRYKLKNKINVYN